MKVSVIEKVAEVREQITVDNTFRDCLQRRC